MQISAVDDGVRRSVHGKMEDGGKENTLGNCGTVPWNGTGIDNKYNGLCVIEVVSVLDPDTWMSRDVHGLNGLFHVW